MNSFIPRHTEAAYAKAQHQSWLTYQNYIAAKKAKQPTKDLLTAHRAAFDEAVRIAQESTPPHRHDQKPNLVFLPQYQVTFCGNDKVSDSNGACSNHDDLENAIKEADFQARINRGASDFVGGQFEVHEIVGRDENSNGPIHAAIVKSNE